VLIIGMLTFVYRTRYPHGINVEKPIVLDSHVKREKTAQNELEME